MKRRDTIGIIALLGCVSLAASQAATAEEQQKTKDEMRTQQQQQKQHQDRTGTKTTGAPIVVFVLPATDTAAQQRNTQNGCWVKLYDDQNFTGDVFTLIGPIDLPGMEGPFGASWEDVSSIQTGPQATVTIYDNANYRDPAEQIRPGQRVQEISKRLGFFEGVESMRVSCS